MAVRDHDERWDELALAHVLGGLRADDASEFRAHLAGCSQCRARVAELRSLDSEMAAAEREERAARRLRTRVEDSPGEDRALEPPEDTGRHRHGLVLVGIVVALLFGLSLWNAHLRAENATLTEVAERQQQTLGTLSGGIVVPVQTSGAVTGVVSVDDTAAALALSGLPTPAADQLLVVWLQRPDGMQSVATYSSLAMGAGRLETTLASIADATALLITLEPEQVPDRPSGQPLLQADLGQG